MLPVQKRTSTEKGHLSDSFVNHLHLSFKLLVHLVALSGRRTKALAGMGWHGMAWDGMGRQRWHTRGVRLLVDSRQKGSSAALFWLRRFATVLVPRLPRAFAHNACCTHCASGMLCTPSGASHALPILPMEGAWTWSCRRPDA